jgi:putative peptidoglycan lipid II flippase
MVQTSLRHAGLALATSAVSVASFVLLLLVLRRKIGHVNGRALFTTFGKTAIAGVVMGLLCFTSSGMIHNLLGMTHKAAFTDLAVSIPLGAGVYFALCKLMHVHGLEKPLEMIAKRFRK